MSASSIKRPVFERARRFTEQFCNDPGCDCRRVISGGLQKGRRGNATVNDFIFWRDPFVRLR